MSDQQIIMWAAWLAFCAANMILSGLFAGAETGIYLLNRVRVELQAEAGSVPAGRLRRFLRSGDNVLSVLLIGTDVHQYFATFAVSAMFVLAGYTDHAEWYTLAVATPLLFVFKDSVPKNVFQRTPELMVYRLSRLLRLADVVFKFTGLSLLVRGFSAGLLRLLGRRAARNSLHLGHEGLAAILAEGHASGALTLSQANMAGRIMAIADVHLGDVLQPMDRVVAVPREISREALLERIAGHDYSRLPMLAEAGQIVGVVDIYDILTDEKQLPPASHMMSPLIIPAEANITEALCILQRNRQALAVVADENQKHVGIVTVKDLVEEIVGELEEW